MHQEQTRDLRTATNDFSVAHGARISSAIEENSTLLVSWLSYLNAFHRTQVADSLLDAVSSSIREVAGVASLGLGRHALFSLRSQIDLLLAWLYFKDHAIEWQHVNQTADGFKLKKDILQYLEQHVPRFSHRMGILREIASRKESDPYKFLSAHVHSQSDPVLPVIKNLKDLVYPERVCAESALVAYEVAEYINDILLSFYLSSWASFPSNIKSALNLRFQSPAQRESFFS
ncbi:hypothetical protein [Bordetella hinzii]|uniref:hypothetical protein n=1 Tax=Bordetella hinzii TaxID=103855 RepID=UPI000671C3A8|nr:hypothetical protein [Bordetella hinzii]AKQ58323.1 hypothetical protein ACR55_00409 [Bordetella hinzii]MBZ0074387.1 hypothetical protein [Bordetella hinzii]MBZ0080334.1 hypothetical protein [Bordetella hinzii]MBZ0083006.1 hypothetical protein [Bordetella hinzii]QET45096.1 hypothetical protein FOB29_16340 [Bordetella hinzii]